MFESFQHDNRSVRSVCVFLAAAVMVVAWSAAASGQAPGWVLDHQKISDTEGGFDGFVFGDDYVNFGDAIAGLGDLDGDGVADMAVGAPGALSNSGAVFVLLLESDGTVKAHQRIDEDEGGFGGTLGANDFFGTSLAALGDLDGDGVMDLAVGASGDNDGASVPFTSVGAVWILFLDTDGTVKAEQKISAVAGGFLGDLDDSDGFGTSVAKLGDLDGNGRPELAVGAPRDDDGAANAGAVWLLHLDADGTVNAHAKISATSGGFGGVLDAVDHFGSGLAGLGDLDRDGLPDLAVGAPLDDDGGSAAGAVWLLFLEADGTVREHAKVGDVQVAGEVQPNDRFGESLAALGDIDADGAPDLAVGAPRDDSLFGPNAERGAVYVLRLNTDGTVAVHQKINDLQGGFSGTLDDGDVFGTGLAFLGDADGDGRRDLVAGAPGDDDGAPIEPGAVWVLMLDGAKTAAWTPLGHALAGASGKPLLVGEGSLQADSDLTLDLTGALEQTDAWLVVGVAELSAPFKGGVLIPDPAPPAQVLPLTTGPTGQVTIDTRWPTGVPAGIRIWFQYWIADVTGPVGYTASNGLVGEAG